MFKSYHAKKEHAVMDSERCFIMLCNWQTEQECLDRNLFGDKAKRLEDLEENKDLEGLRYEE
jgi:hypothetical protein